MRRIAVGPLPRHGRGPRCRDAREVGEEARAGLGTCLRAAAVHGEPGRHERTEQPGPRSALVVGAVALGGTADIAGTVVRIRWAERAQADRGQQLSLGEATMPARSSGVTTSKAGRRRRAPGSAGFAGPLPPCTSGLSSTSIRPPLSGSGKAARKLACARSARARQRSPPAQAPATRRALIQSACTSTGLPAAAG